MIIFSAKDIQTLATLKPLAAFLAVSGYGCSLTLNQQALLYQARVCHRAGWLEDRPLIQAAGLFPDEIGMLVGRIAFDGGEGD